MIQVLLNPFGIAYTLGLMNGTAAAPHPRANPKPLDIWGYLELAERIGARGVELPIWTLDKLPPGELADVAGRIRSRNWTTVIAQATPAKDLERSIEKARLLGARVIRCSLTPILCGDRAAPNCDWPKTLADVRQALKDAAVKLADSGLSLAIENHQDFTSGELVELCVEAGENIGICLDTGNALAVGEDPIEFARTISPRLRHIHFKDYRASWCDDGYRLVRCAIGDGAIPFAELARLLDRPEGMTAAIEPGALSARHIKLFNGNWWNGYPARSADSLARGMLAARVRRLGENEEWRTPWELGEGPEQVVAYEMQQLERSVANLRALGLM